MLIWSTNVTYVPYKQQTNMKIRKNSTRINIEQAMHTYIGITECDFVRIVWHEPILWLEGNSSRSCSWLVDTHVH